MEKFKQDDKIESCKENIVEDIYNVKKSKNKKNDENEKTKNDK